MFAQVIQGKATDAAGLQKQWERWDRDIKPNAQGFLGSTGGVTSDGEFIIIARFQSEESARANSDRAEQSEWWKETSQYLSDTLFHDCTEVDLINDGRSDGASFVQIIEGKSTDVVKSRELGARMEPQLKELRPDMIGGITAWHPQNGRFTSAVHYTSETEARAYQQRMVSAEGFQGYMREIQALSDEEPRFLDLTDPWISNK